MAVLLERRISTPQPRTPQDRSLPTCYQCTIEYGDGSRPSHVSAFRDEVRLNVEKLRKTYAPPGFEYFHANVPLWNKEAIKAYQQNRKNYRVQTTAFDMSGKRLSEYVSVYRTTPRLPSSVLRD